MNTLQQMQKNRWHTAEQLGSSVKELNAMFQAGQVTRRRDITLAEGRQTTVFSFMVKGR